MEECKSPFGGVILDPHGRPECCRAPKDNEVQPFANVMVKAWTNPDYRKQLLTFPEGQATDWFWYDKAARASMLNRTRAALEKFQVPLGPDEIPVVLGNMQFERGVYRKWDINERVLRLPDEPSAMSAQLRSMSFYAFMINSNVCGM
ncbi:MAG TPA: hypothetical protein VFB20_15480 [Burkholderiales bacterium]|nr:hypothetical protein [Burkholderiales bacterium]